MDSQNQLSEGSNSSAFISPEGNPEKSNNNEIETKEGSNSIKSSQMDSFFHTPKSNRSSNNTLPSPTNRASLTLPAPIKISSPRNSNFIENNNTIKKKEEREPLEKIYGHLSMPTSPVGRNRVIKLRFNNQTLQNVVQMRLKANKVSYSPSKFDFHGSFDGKNILTESGISSPTRATSKIFVSQYKNFPTYSFSPRSSNKNIITKDHIQDFIGKDTPGAGAYRNEDVNAVKPASPRCVINNALRFACSPRDRCISNIPHSYRGPTDSGSISPRTLGGTIGNFTRFKKSDWIHNRFPGPGSYSNEASCDFLTQSFDPSCKSILSKMKTTNLNTTTTFRTHISSRSNLYSPEYKKEFLNRDGPGPGIYELQKNPAFTKRVVSFGKEKRRLLEPKKDELPSPCSYSPRDETKTEVRATAKFSVPKAKRIIDFRGSTATNKEIWKKIMI